jgi:hypothetical protein
MTKKKGICKVSFNGDFPDKEKLEIQFYKHKGLHSFDDFDKCTILQNMIGLLTKKQELYANRYYKELEKRADSLGSGMFEADERYLKNSKNWSGKIRFHK